MDAAYNFFKTVLFVVATALLLSAPICAFAQPSIIINPALGAGGTIQIGSQGCNDYQTLNLTSTGAAIPLTVTATYNPSNSSSDPVNGQWLYARLDASGVTGGGTGGTTIGGAGVSSTIPASTNTTGINLIIGLQHTFLSLTEQGFVTLTPTGGGAAPITITVNYSSGLFCGTSTPITNGYVTVTPGMLTMTAAQGNSQTLTLQIQNDTATSLLFLAATPSVDPWLSTNATSATALAGTSTATVIVTANATGLGVTSYTGQVTITTSSGNPLTVPVTFAVTTVPIVPALSGWGLGATLLLLLGSGIWFVKPMGDDDRS
jgi:hypothetical protein